MCEYNVSLIFSGLLPNMTTDEMHGCMSSFQRWLMSWCPANGVSYIDRWQFFCGRHSLIRWDGIHPTLNGDTAMSRSLAHSNSLNQSRQ